MDVEEGATQIRESSDRTTGLQNVNRIYRRRRVGWRISALVSAVAATLGGIDGVIHEMRSSPPPSTHQEEISSQGSYISPTRGYLDLALLGLGTFFSVYSLGQASLCGRMVRTSTRIQDNREREGSYKTL